MSDRRRESYLSATDLTQAELDETARGGENQIEAICVITKTVGETTYTLRVADRPKFVGDYFYQGRAKFPAAVRTLAALQSPSVQYSEMEIELANADGFYNQYLVGGANYFSFIGARLEVKIGLRDIAASFKTVFDGIVPDQDGFSAGVSALVIRARDKFASLSVAVPLPVINETDYPSAPNENLGKMIPLVLGDWTAGFNVNEGTGVEVVTVSDVQHNVLTASPSNFYGGVPGYYVGGGHFVFSIGTFTPEAVQACYIKRGDKILQCNFNATPANAAGYWTVQVTNLKTDAPGTCAYEYQQGDVAMVSVKVPYRNGTDVYSNPVALAETILDELADANLGTNGTSTSGAAPSTDISAGSAYKLVASVDGGVPVTVRLTLAGLDTGAKIAAALEAQINASLAVAGQDQRVWAEFTSSVYVLTSQTKGTTSAVVITSAGSNDVAAALKLGAGNGGTEAAGTAGDFDLDSWNHHRLRFAAAPGSANSDPSPWTADLRFNGNLTDEAGHTFSAPNGSGQTNSKSKYGSGSYQGNGQMLANGANYLQATSNDFIVGTGDFTVELWYWITAYVGCGILFNIASGIDLLEQEDGKIRLYDYTVSNYGPDTTYHAPTGEWIHLALVRKNGVIRVFANGTKLYEYSNDHNFTSNIIRLGSDGHFGNYAPNGYIDGWKFSAGNALYWADFTPPTSEGFDGGGGDPGIPAPVKLRAWIGHPEPTARAPKGLVVAASSQESVLSKAFNLLEHVQLELFVNASQKVALTGVVFADLPAPSSCPRVDQWQVCDSGLDVKYDDRTYFNAAFANYGYTPILEKTQVQTVGRKNQGSIDKVGRRIAKVVDVGLVYDNADAVAILDDLIRLYSAGLEYVTARLTWPHLLRDLGSFVSFNYAYGGTSFAEKPMQVRTKEVDLATGATKFTLLSFANFSYTGYNPSNASRFLSGAAATIENDPL